MSSVTDLVASVAALCAKPAIRFTTSGTLITLFALADFLVRRRRPRAPHAARPRWIKPLITVSVVGFYALIGPTGGPLMGGYGNLLGVALVAVAITITVRASGAVRHPELAGRSLFYVALPLAVGTPWGLLALSLPACATSFYLASREERVQVASEPPARPRYRMIPGLW